MQNPLLASYVDYFHRNVTEFCSETLKKKGITVGLMYLVLYVCSNPGCTPIQLSKDLGLDRAYVLRCIQKLNSDGFIKREPHPTDGRATVLYATDKGLDIYETGRGLLHSWDEHMLEDVTPQEKQELFKILAKIKQKG